MADKIKAAGRLWSQAEIDALPPGPFQTYERPLTSAERASGLAGRCFVETVIRPEAVMAYEPDDAVCVVSNGRSYQIGQFSDDGTYFKRPLPGGF